MTQTRRTAAGMVAAMGAILVLSVGIGSAWAVDPADAPAPDAPAADAAAPKKPKKGGIIVLDAIKVEGRIQKPQAFYILQRTNLNFTSLELERSFLPDIEKSVLKDPF